MSGRTSCAVGASERVFELVDRAPEIRTGSVTLPQVRGDVILSEVEFAYPTRQDVPVLKMIDLRLAPGEVVALVGPSEAVNQPSQPFSAVFTIRHPVKSLSMDTP